MQSNTITRRIKVPRSWQQDSLSEVVRKTREYVTKAYGLQETDEIHTKVVRYQTTKAPREVVTTITLDRSLGLRRSGTKWMVG